MLKVATVLPHEPYREYKDVERVYSGSTEIDKILDKNGNVLFAVNKEVEGTPALTYKGKEETILKNYRIYGNTETKTRSYSGSAPLNFPIVDGSVSNYRIHGNTENGESVGGLVTDSQSEHYGEYTIPITNNSETANIYLDEPLRKVGDEAEYVDYAEQKWHRVRKNLLQNTATRQTINGVTFTVNEDGSVTCNGTASDTAEYRLDSNFLLPAGNYCLTGIPPSGSASSYYLRAWYISSGSVVWINDYGKGRNFTLTDTTKMYSSIVVWSGKVLNNITFYPMIRKADITDDTYEPYIENTEVDVTVPALPSQSSTNSLSVGTAAQPSSVAVDVDEVVSCGDRTGNLFDLNTWANTIRNINGNGLMSISGNTISITSVNNADCFTMPYVDSQIGVYKIPVKPNTIYTVNWYGSNYRILLFKNGTLDRIYTYDTSDGSRSFTTDSDATFVTISFGVKPTNPVGTTATISDFMISEGSTALPYEPYGYKVPVTVEGKNLFDMKKFAETAAPLNATVNYSENSLIFTATQVDAYVNQVYSQLNIPTALRSSCINVHPLTTYTISMNTPYKCYITWADDSFNPVAAYTEIPPNQPSYTFTTPSNCTKLHIRLGKQVTNIGDTFTISNIMLNEGSTALPYEPYQTPITTNIYLPEQIKMVGDEAEYIDYAEQKMHRIGADDIDVTLPALPVLPGTNVLSVGTEVQPSNVYLKGRIKEIT